MKYSPTFRAYLDTDLNTCLQLFERNCPLAFAPNERSEYEDFLKTESNSGYELCLNHGGVVGAFGLHPLASFLDQAAIRWIMLDPAIQRAGIGTAVMNHILNQAQSKNIKLIHIAASQVSQAFFVRFGAQARRETKDGWGPGMHRIDMELEI